MLKEFLASGVHVEVPFGSPLEGSGFQSWDQLTRSAFLQLVLQNPWHAPGLGRNRRSVRSPRPPLRKSPPIPQRRTFWQPQSQLRRPLAEKQKPLGHAKPPLAAQNSSAEDSALPCNAPHSADTHRP